MKTLSVISERPGGSDAARRLTLQKSLLTCGILASLLYTATIVAGAQAWPGYDPISQAVSELFAIQAPSRPLVVPLLLGYALLMCAFGWGVWKSAGPVHAWRIAAVLIIAKEVLGPAATVFFPIHLRGVEPTLSDTLHMVLTMMGVFVCMFPAMVFGAIAAGKRFRIYTVATILVFLVSNLYTFSQASNVAANLPTPYAGLTERILIFAYIVWIDVLAIKLLLDQPDSLQPEEQKRVVESRAVPS